MLSFFKRVLAWLGLESNIGRECVRQSKYMREHLSERQIDKTLQDTFPASDPPAWY